MKKPKLLMTAGLGTLLVLSVACSSNKVAQQSAVQSHGDAKGTAPSSAVAKQAEKAMVRFVNGTADSEGPCLWRSHSL